MQLHAALVDFAATFGNPWSSKPLRELAEGRKLPAAQKILGAFEKTGAIVPALRGPVTPSRERTLFSARAMSRPDAAAAPSSKAVPEGASTLLRWCISSTSIS